MAFRPQRTTELLLGDPVRLRKAVIAWLTLSAVYAAPVFVGALRGFGAILVSWQVRGGRQRNRHRGSHPGPCAREGETYDESRGTVKSAGETGSGENRPGEDDLTSGFPA